MDTKPPTADGSSFSSGAAVRVRSGEVVHQTIDGEVVVINLITGSYFSIEGTGAEIWGLLVTGVSPADLLGYLEQHYDADRGTLGTSLETFLSDLSSQRIIESVAQLASIPAAPSRAVENSTPAGRKAFVAPTLSIYTDMKEFLLLDPIHDVGQSGWPQPQS